MIHKCLANDQRWLNLVYPSSEICCLLSCLLKGCHILKDARCITMPRRTFINDVSVHLHQLSENTNYERVSFNLTSVTASRVAHPGLLIKIGNKISHRAHWVNLRLGIGYDNKSYEILHVVIRNINPTEINKAIDNVAFSIFKCISRHCNQPLKWRFWRADISRQFKKGSLGHQGNYMLKNSRMRGYFLQYQGNCMGRASKASMKRAKWTRSSTALHISRYIEIDKGPNKNGVQTRLGPCSCRVIRTAV